MNTKYLHGCGILFWLGFDIKDTNIRDFPKREKCSIFTNILYKILLMWLLFCFLLKKIVINDKTNLISAPLTSRTVSLMDLTLTKYLYFIFAMFALKIFGWKLCKPDIVIQILCTIHEK